MISYASWPRPVQLTLHPQVVGRGGARALGRCVHYKSTCTSTRPSGARKEVVVERYVPWPDRSPFPSARRGGAVESQPDDREAERSEREREKRDNRREGTATYLGTGLDRSCLALRGQRGSQVSSKRERQDKTRRDSLAERDKLQR